MDPRVHTRAPATSTPTWAHLSHLRGGTVPPAEPPARTRQSRGAARHRVENERCCRYNNIPVKVHTFGVFRSGFGVGHTFLPLQREATPHSDPPGPRAERQSEAHPSRPHSASGTHGAVRLSCPGATLWASGSPGGAQAQLPGAGQPSVA